MVQMPNITPFYGAKLCPIVGRIGSIKVAIPQHFVLGPVAYKNVDIWNPDSYRNMPRQPTLESDISNFAIKIRMTNFKPVHSSKDVEDYDKLSRSVENQPPVNRWLYVEFFTQSAAEVDNAMKNLVRNWLKDDAKDGPFSRTDDAFGLHHYVSAQLPFTQRYPYIQKNQQEFFYDPIGERTFIRCRNVIQLPREEAAVPNILLSHCQIDYWIKELNIRVSVANIEDKGDLARWREIERGVEKTIRSFIVYN